MLPNRRPDPLTGLANKAAFDADLRQAIAVAHQTGRPLGLLMVDIDNLKIVNDTHSLATGDDVVREVAARLRGEVEVEGAAYRWGGEEMTVLLPNHPMQEAAVVAERVRRSVAASPIAQIPVSVSIGLALLPDHATDAEGLLDAAESAVLSAKRRGRNRVCRFKTEL